MPLYDFRCTSCGVKFEEYAKMNDKLATCEECGGTANRLITSRIHLDTDYASKALVTDDITGSAIRITSKKQRRELCEKHGVYIKEGPPSNKTRDRREYNRELASREKSGKRQYFRV